MSKPKLTSDEFIKQWWKRRFTEAKEPTWDAAITCADAADLLDKKNSERT